MSRIGVPLLLCGLLLSPQLHGQLRPLEPVAWEVFENGTVASARAGFGAFADQKASLAGTQGRLLEVGNFHATWRHGRIAVEAGGTVRRVFRDQSRFADSFGGALDEHGPRRVDSGDYRAATSIQLTPIAWTRALGIVRFGTRLPTTNNRVGLDRDQTDFFALAGGRFRTGHLVLSAESGVGIYGTRYPHFEQSDLLIYTLTTELPVGRVTPRISALGQIDLSSGEPLRGNEDLAELRLGARLELPLLLDVELVHGFTSFSPRTGLLVSVGSRR